MEGKAFRIHEYPCNQIPCPNCSAAIHFTTLHLSFGPQPFMYCGECSNVLFRASDLDALDKVLAGATDIAAATLRFYEDLEQSAPLCPCGGRFTLWANVKCPTCGHETPYNDGVCDPEVRVFDDMIVVIDGAIVLKDEAEKSWQYRCSK